MRRVCSLLALLSLARGASGVSFIVRPGGKEECVNEVLSAEALRPGMTLPETFLGRSAFLLRPMEGGFPGAAPSLQATIRGPSGLVLWQQQITPSFKDDAVFGGNGLGDYSLCFTATVPPGSEPWPEDTGVAVDFFYLFPYEGAIDPAFLEQPAGSPSTSAVVLEDVATAAGVTLRLQAVVRRLSSDQEHLLRRQSRHNDTLVSNDRRVVRWTLIEVATLIALSALQFSFARAAFRNY